MPPPELANSQVEFSSDGTWVEATPTSVPWTNDGRVIFPGSPGRMHSLSIRKTTATPQTVIVTAQVDLALLDNGPAPGERRNPSDFLMQVSLNDVPQEEVRIGTIFAEEAPFGQDDVRIVGVPVTLEGDAGSEHRLQLRQRLPADSDNRSQRASILNSGVFITPQEEPEPPTSLTVDYWSDRVVDGAYDTSVTDVDGRTDERPSSGYVYLKDADGSWWSTSPGEDGRFTFPGIAPGEAQVFFTVPNDQMTVMDGDDEHLKRTDEHGGRDVTYVDPDDGSQVPARIPQGIQLYEGAAQVEDSADEGGAADADDAAEFRSSLVRSQATIELDGEQVGDEHARVEFGNNDDWFTTAADDDGLLFYPEAADGSGMQAFGAHTASVRVEAADGYEVESVTASTDDAQLPVAAGENGTYTLETAELPTSFSVIGWKVELAESEDEPSEPGPTDPAPPGEPSPDDPGSGDDPDGSLPGTGATWGLVIIVAALLAVSGGTVLTLRRQRH